VIPSRASSSGILAHAFARARCGGCGYDFLIAYSCKGRGVYPSCNTRRMAGDRGASGGPWVSAGPATAMGTLITPAPALFPPLGSCTHHSGVTDISGCGRAPAQGSKSRCAGSSTLRSGDLCPSLRLRAQWLDRVAALIPPPRRHRPRYPRGASFQCPSTPCSDRPCRPIRGTATRGGARKRSRPSATPTREAAAPYPLPLGYAARTDLGSLPAIDN
jgi:hypothetical protein